MHWRKPAHRNSHRNYKERIPRGRNISPSGIPTNTSYATVQEVPNCIRVLKKKRRPCFTYNPQITHPGNLEKVKTIIFALTDPEIRLPSKRSLDDSNTTGLYTYKTYNEDHQVGFYYEILVPPDPVPIHGYFNLTPSHTLGSTETKSLQMGLTSALYLLRMCKAAHNSSKVIALSPVAWKHYINNLHRYPK